MTIVRTVLRRTRTLLWTALSILIILAAVVVGVGKLLMPYSKHYQPELEAWLSAEFGRPVVLDSFTGEWNAFGPRLRLRGMRVLSPSPDGSGGELAISEAALDIKPLNALLPGKAWYNFLVIGANFTLVEHGDGRFELSGLGVHDSDRRPVGGGLRNLVGIGELVLENSTLEFRRPDRRLGFRLTGIDARVQLTDDSGAVTLQASLDDGPGRRVYGEVQATALLGFSQHGKLTEARWHLALQDVMLDALREHVPENRFLPQQGLVNGAFWGDWLAGRPLVVRGVADLRNARLSHGDDAVLVEHANARIGWIFANGGDWRLDLHDLRVDDGILPWQAPDIALARNLDQGVGIWVSADTLPLGVTLQLARDVLSVYGRQRPEGWPRSAEGEVAGLELVLDANWHPRLVRGDVRGAGVGGWDRWPTVSGIDADIDLEAGEGDVMLHAAALQVDWPGMFAEKLRFSLPSCRLGVDLDADWQLQFRDCSLINDDLAVNGDLRLVGNGGRPAVDANVAVTRGSVSALSAYWPERILKPKVLAWLRRSLVDGEIEEGRAQIFGDMDDWPFLGGQGRFEATARVSGGTLDFAPGWPRVDELDADLHFVNASMRIDAGQGRIGGVPVRTATAEIANFKRALLDVHYAAESTVPGLLDFLRVTPILSDAGDLFDRFQFGGSAATRGEIHLPLGLTPGEPRVDGSVTVMDGRFSDPESGFALSGISGKLHYDRSGLRAEALDSRYRERPAVLALNARRTGQERFRATLTGRFDVQDVLPDFLRGVEPLDRVSGESDWRAVVVLPARPGGQGPAIAGSQVIPWLEVESQLEDVAIDLPAPLHKAPGESVPFRLRYPLGGALRVLDLGLEDRARLRVELKPDPDDGTAGARVLRAAASLGGDVPELPDPGYVRVEGRPQLLDLDGWIDLVTDLASRRPELGHLRLERCRLQAEKMLFLDRSFADVGLDIGADAADIRADFSGDAIDGHVLFTPGARAGSLSAEFERLALGEPVTSGVAMRANPAALPELHLYARSFRYAGVEMGETRIEAYPSSDGFHFEKVEAESDSLTLRATGDWLVRDGAPRSDFRILVTTESLGDLLESMGISSALAGGQTVLRFNAWWPGPPGAFALSRLNGEVEFTITRGQITNASPGSGRLLGLLSIQALPRRLSLDFRDVFDSGFDFEEAHGTFRMENGMASTDDVELSSSAAKISLKGSTDLVAQRYDQVMTVQPGVGNTLPVIGAIAGGPGGAAAGLALQGLLHDELGEATQVQYTITGSWEQPTIEPVLKGGTSEPAADGS